MLGLKVFTDQFLLNVLLLPFTKVESQFDQVQQDSVRKSIEIILISKFAVLAQKLSTIYSPMYFI